MALLAFFAVLTLNGLINDRAASDEALYHLPTIEQFARQWPRPGLRDYRSATGPGYHLLMAAARVAGLHGALPLRLLSASIGLVLVGVLAIAVRSNTMPWTMAAACLPMATSLYVVGTTVWLAPDTLAWLCVLLAILLTRRRWIGRFVLALFAVNLALTVFVRQINLWPWAGMCVAVMMPATFSPYRKATLARDWPWKLIGVFATAVPALLILFWFHHLWGGLVPPAFQTIAADRAHVPAWHSGWQHEGPNLAVPTMVLAVFGVTGCFFLGFLPIEKVRQSARWIALGAFVGLIVSIIPATTWSEDAGRYSGLWNIAHRLPAIGNHSPLMIALATLGGAMLAAWGVALDRRDRCIWLALWLAFIAAQTANAMAWQKYYEPFCLMMLPLGAARVLLTHQAPRWAWIGPVTLAISLSVVTLCSMHF